MDRRTVYSAVNNRYGATARASTNNKYGSTVAQAFGYSAEDLASIPLESNLGLSCGNPLALVNVQEGETVVDLGSGAGFDVFLAAKKVGEKGRAIGVDMNEDMLAKAHSNAAKANITNTLFVFSKITQIDLPSNTADVIISNCVINLVPDVEKHLVFKEIYRLLRPGGRVAISDILARKEMTQDMKNDIALYVGCVAGASKVEEYEKWLQDAGFNDAVIVDAKSDLNVYTQTEEEGKIAGSICCGPVTEEENVIENGCCKPKINEVGKGSCCEPKVEKTCCAPEDSQKSGCVAAGKEDGGVAADLRSQNGQLDLNEWAGSYKIYAVKPTEKAA